MNKNDILIARLNQVDGAFPAELLTQAIQAKDSLAPDLLALLKDMVAQYETFDLNRLDYIFALYLLAKFRNHAAFPVLIQIALLPGDWPERILDDCITEGLPRFFISCYNGDLAALKSVIENTNANCWSRRAAMNALLGLVVNKTLTRSEVVTYLKSLFNETLLKDTDFVTGLVDTCCNIYPEECLAEITAAFKKKQVDKLFIELDSVKEVMAMGKAECLATFLYNNPMYLPIDNLEETMNWMAVFHPLDKSYLD